MTPLPIEGLVLKELTPLVATACAAATLTARVPPAEPSAEPGATLFDAPSRVVTPLARPPLAGA